MPSAICGISKTPIGPFQKIVFAFDRCSVYALSVAGPMSTTIWSFGTSSIGTTRVLAR